MFDEIEIYKKFSESRLRSYYIANPRLMCPAITMLREAKGLLADKHYAACVVFHAIAIELLLKATILRPVVAGLVHIESLAEIVMSHAIAKEGYGQYLKLLNQVFKTLVGADLRQIRRAGSKQTLWEEASKVRESRNTVVHKGESRTKEDAELSRDVSWAVYKQFVIPVLKALDLKTKQHNGVIGNF